MSSRPGRRVSVHFDETPSYYPDSPPSPTQSSLLAAPHQLHRTPEYPMSSTTSSPSPSEPFDAYISPVSLSPQSRSRGAIVVPPSPTLPTVPLPTVSRTPTPPQRPEPFPFSDVVIHEYMSSDALTDESFTILHDVRDNIEEARLSNRRNTTEPREVPPEMLEQCITQPSTPILHLVCRLLPWVIVVENPMGVTCGDVIEKVQRSLWREIDLEAREPQLSDEEKERARCAYEVNCAYTRHHRRMVALDVLGEHVVLRGLQKLDGVLAETLGASEVYKDKTCLALVFKGPGRVRPSSPTPTPDFVEGTPSTDERYL